MFSKSTLFAVLNDNSLKKFHMSNTLNEMRRFLETIFSRYEGFSKTKYEYGYKNEFNELFFVDNCVMEQRIIEAIDDASSVPPLSINENDMLEIKYIFMGSKTKINNIDSTKILFQKIQKSQVISKDRGVKIFRSGNTLDVYTDNLLSILDRLDCYYIDGKLFFNNMYYARQVFDMKDYIIEGTVDDIRAFANHSIFASGNEEFLLGNTNQNIRNKIKVIIDSGILEAHTARNVKDISELVGLNLAIQEENGVQKLILPRENNGLKCFLKILDETIYEGLLSKELKESNSSKPYRR